MMSIDHVLIIEDDGVSAMLLQYLIEDVLSATSITLKENGEKALVYLEEFISKPDQFPDLIFLDLNMPLMNGYDFIELYEEKFAPLFPATQLVVLTSSVRNKDIEIAQRYSSIKGFYNKPLEEEQLLQIKGSLESR